MLARFIEHEYVDPADMQMRGMAAALGIVKGQPFKPDDKARALLDKAARTASRMGHVVAYTPSPLVKDGLYYPDRRWINAFPAIATFTAPTFDYLDTRVGFFTYAYSTSPGMATHMENVGAKYPLTLHGRGRRLPERRQELQAESAGRHSGQDLLVGHRLRSADRLGPRQRPAFPVAQHDGQAGRRTPTARSISTSARSRPAKARTGCGRFPTKASS